MRALLGLALVFVVSAALAEPLDSPEFGFSVDFPCTPHEDRGNGTRANGKLIADSTTFGCQVEGQYFVGLSVDRYYSEPYPTLVDVRNGFLQGFQGTASLTQPSKVHGHDALQFTFENTANPDLHGHGFVVHLSGTQELFVTVVIVRTPKTTGAELDSLEHFLASFSPKR